MKIKPLTRAIWLALISQRAARVEPPVGGESPHPKGQSPSPADRRLNPKPEETKDEDV